jgi:hypothetical protein
MAAKPAKKVSPKPKRPEGSPKEEKSEGKKERMKEKAC